MKKEKKGKKGKNEGNKGCKREKCFLSHGEGKERRRDSPADELCSSSQWDELMNFFD